MSEMTLYKVLKGDRPCHGGSPDFVWPLPTEDGPGEWVSVPGPLRICENALHGTSSPIDWWVKGSTLYTVEFRGETAQQGDKVAGLEARLIAVEPWSAHGIYCEGEHRVTEGFHRAYDSATVRAYDSATVRAYDSVTVEAYGSATVGACDSATVRAYDSATVEAYGSATVRAYDSATVEAYDSVTVESTVYHSPSAMVALSQMAAHVDRRGGRLVLRGARGGDHEVPA